MKVIFLDVDGVLNDTTDYTTKWEITTAHMNVLKSIIEQTGARIIVSSAWRYAFGSRRKLERALEAAGLVKDGETPKLGFSLNPPMEKKEEEILAWLEAHPDVDTYAILDDHEDFCKQLAAHQVKTVLGEGLLEKHIAETIALIGVLEDEPEEEPEEEPSEPEQQEE